LPMHVVFIAQERTGKNEEEGTVERGPALTPAVAGIATSAVDIIGRMTKRKVRVVNKRTRRVTEVWRPVTFLGPSDDYLTKDRSNGLRDIEIGLTMERVIKAAETVERED
jgi:hypothetical protein